MTMLRNPLSSGLFFLLLENIQTLKLDVSAQAVPVSTAFCFSPAEELKQHVSGLHQVWDICNYSFSSYGQNPDYCLSELTDR